jgi:membrane protease YdiL (CAAX protease family)
VNITPEQSTSITINQDRPATKGIGNILQQRPLVSTVVLSLAWIFFATLFGIAAKMILPEFEPEFVALVAISITVTVFITVIGWWNEIGFNRPVAWRDLRLLWLPAIVVMVLPFLAGIRPVEPGSFFYLVAAYALTGIIEEAWFRGVVMRVLRPLGTVPSVVISAALFGLIHAGNFLYRNPLIVLAQMFGAFVHGIGLGALRLRTNTIWAVVVLHGLHDLALKYTRFPAIPLDVIQVTLLMLYGIYLLRKPASQEPASNVIPQ